MRHYPMGTWIIKSETDDPDRALANVEDQRGKGYTAWIEDENGTAVDERLLKMNGRVAIKRTLTERMAPLVVAASVVAAIVVLYFVGLWVD